MGITDAPFVWGITVISALFFLFGVLVLPRSRRPGLKKYLAQALVFLVTIVLALASVAAWLNQENQWYTSWQELFDPSAAHTSSVENFGAADSVLPAAHVDQTASEIQKNPITNPAFSGQVKNTDQGQYFTVKVPGSASSRSMDVMVYLPAGYLQNSDQFYPVIMGFPGFPGSSTTYSKDIDYGKMLEDKFNSGEMGQAILVVPDVYPGTFDSECVDSDAGTSTMEPPHTETYVTQDLVPWIKNNLRTIDNSGAWATSGYSAGGWCASMFTVKHPDIFGSALVQAGYFEPIYTDGQQWLDPKDPRYLLGDIVAQDKPEVGIYFYTSAEDDLPKASLGTFKEAVQAPTELVVATVPVGGHRVDVWIPGIGQGLDWLAHRSPYFAHTS